jgi:EmrB/QacA subfamily drug resistance transporter
MTALLHLLRPRTDNPWNALWALLVGFFMILLDATIVAVANPSIMDALHVDYASVIWVTSAYLLAYAVPLLLAGRLGDRFGPRNLYLVGLAVFTVASLWCGLAGSIETLIAARSVQGIGAALLTPQTLSTITRIFPAERRGVALSVWGATAGVATLVGPLAGGVLVDGLGWQWIFIVNVPIGLVGLVLALIFVPTLPTEKHGFDVLGVVLSGVGMFLIVFALQEGQTRDWAPWIWGLLLAGVAAMVGFVYWQAVNPDEPLIPLKVFRDNDFRMSNVGIAVIGFAVTAMILPVMFYAQAVCGLSPTRSALLTAPMAIVSGVLAPFVGKLVDRTHPRPIVGFGFSALAIALTWLSIEMTPTTPIWRLLLPFVLMGIGMAFIWSPLAATATRTLPPELAGAGSGVYNTTRQVGSVLGSAGMAALMTSQISAAMPGETDPGVGQGAVTQLPSFLHAPFAAALSQSLLLPAFVALLGVVAALFLRGSLGGPAAEPSRLVDARTYVEPDYFLDDDDYVEYTVDWSSEDEDEPVPPVQRQADAPARGAIAADESVTVPLAVAVDDEPDTVPQLIATAERYRSPEPIGFAHNGFHVEVEVPVPVPPPPSPRGGRHSRDDEQADGDAGTYGRHSMRFRD